MQSNWTAASVKNIRRQRQLELELLDIERRWHLELKYINRKRLAVIYDLNRYTNLRRNAEHTSDGLSGIQLRQYTRVCQDKMLEQRVTRRRSRKFDFNVDPVERMNIRLPPIDVDTTAEKHGVMENVTSSDLNRKRASFQKGAAELNQFLMRTMRRTSRSKSDLEDEEDELDDVVDESHDGDLVRSNTRHVSIEPLTSHRKFSTSQFLPPIQET